MPETEQKSQSVNLPSTDEARQKLGAGGRTRDDADQDFGEAFIHSQREHRVLGMRLLPYSFWHAALLDYIESPFAGYSGKLDIAALYAAARICQMRHPERPRRREFEYLRELYLAKRYNDNFKIVASEGKLARAISPFLRELNKFSIYIRDYHARPTYVPVKDGKPIHVPWYFYEVCLLRRFSELSLSAAWNTPVGEGSWTNVGMLEAHGNEAPILTAAQRVAFKRTQQVRKPSEKLLARVAAAEPMRARVRR